MKLLTTEQIKSLERAADAAGHSYADMMERAGKAVAELARDLCPRGVSNALVLVGPGNNGGDGLVAARYLHEWDIDVTVYIWRRQMANDPNLALVQEQGIALIRAEKDVSQTELERLANRADVIVDALLGTGARGPLRGGLDTLLTTVKTVWQQRRASPHQVTRLLPRGAIDVCPRPMIIAVDLPSGLNADTGEIDPRALKADTTLTFAHPKRGLLSFPGAEFAGELLVADIDIPSGLCQDIPLNVITAASVAAMLPLRQSQGHKGTFGSVLILGGSNNYVGAPCLAGKAAYRAGAGLVTLATPAAVHPMAATLLPEATHLLLPHSLGALVNDAWDIIEAELGRYQVLLIGPGMGQDDQTRMLLQTVLSGGAHRAHRAIGFGNRIEPSTLCALPPLVIDADGLNLLAKLPDWPSQMPPQTIITPHPGEMARLCGMTVAQVNHDRLDIAGQAAQDWQCVVVLKGAFTVVASPDGQTWVNPCANAALASAGTGDVLAGAIAGLRAQGCSAIQAALCGVYLHGLAASIWSERHGDSGMLAGELSDLLPDAKKRLLENEKQGMPDDIP